jgi:hypothetical protein
MSDEDKGLYQKYEVQRLNDTTGKHDDCEYFVLDPTHDAFAKHALVAYAIACRDKYPVLADDLLTMVFGEDR